MLGSIAIAACSAAPERASEGSGSGTPLQAAAPIVRHHTPETLVMLAPSIALPKQESFVVKDTGKGAKAALRYAVAVGASEHRVETRLTSRQLDHGTIGAPIELPPIRDGFAITIANRDGPIAMRPLPAEIVGKPHPIAEQYVASWRTKLQSRRVDVTFDGRGAFSTIAFNDDPTNQRSAASKDELVQRLLGMTVPVPEVPVAIGATWVVTTVLRQGPVYIKQTATYTLTERTATKWKLRAKLLRVGEEQTVLDPALPPGGTADLIALFRLLEGDLEINPTRALVARGRLSVESRVHAKIRLPGEDVIEQFVEDTGSITFSSSP